MIEELIKNEAKHNSEFRSEMRKEMREMRKDIKALNALRAQVIAIATIVSGAASVLAKKFLG